MKERLLEGYCIARNCRKCPPEGKALAECKHYVGYGTVKPSCPFSIKNLRKPRIIWDNLIKS